MSIVKRVRFEIDEQTDTATITVPTGAVVSMEGNVVTIRPEPELSSEYRPVFEALMDYREAKGL